MHDSPDKGLLTFCLVSVCSAYPWAGCFGAILIKIHIIANEIEEVSNSKKYMENRIKETIDNFIKDNPDVVLTDVDIELTNQRYGDGTITFVCADVKTKVEIL